MSRSGGTMLTFSGEILLLLNCQSRNFWRRIASYSQSCSSPVRAECDLKEFFQHENQIFPAVLSESRRLYSCQNSQLMSILETRVVPTDQESKADVLIVDGSALVHALPPRRGKTFESSAFLAFLPVIQTYSSRYDMTHSLWCVQPVQS